MEQKLKCRKQLWLLLLWQPTKIQFHFQLSAVSVFCRMIIIIANYVKYEYCNVDGIDNVTL